VALNGSIRDEREAARRLVFADNNVAVLKLRHVIRSAWSCLSVPSYPAESHPDGANLTFGNDLAPLRRAPRCRSLQ
jgi:hypothetical protein